LVRAVLRTSAHSLALFSEDFMSNPMDRVHIS
jgi:hypothetical protein